MPCAATAVPVAIGSLSRTVTSRDRDLELLLADGASESSGR